MARKTGKQRAEFASPDRPRDKDILWRSVRYKTRPMETDAFNFHDFTTLQDTPLLSVQMPAAPPVAKQETWRLAEWKPGEASGSRKRADKAASAKKPDLQPGELRDLDRSTAEKFRRGKLPVEARLDLHGLNQDAAVSQLKTFIDLSCLRGCRCVLVVTGKGDPRKGGGVLKRQVPHWLNLPENRGRILAVANAQPKDGGGGALYVLLKRRR